MDPDLNIKLIKEVKRFACLYDLTSPEYRNTKWKDTIWKKIAADLNTKDIWCKKRWKTLRDTYRKKRRLEGMETCSTKPISNKKFKFAQEMSFLEGVTDGRSYCPSDDDDYDANETGHSGVEASWTALPSPADSLTPKHEDSTSNLSAPSYKASSTKKTENHVNPASDPLAARKSTLLLFESLAHKIMSAGLSESDADAIELKVASVVYEELAKLRQQRQSI
ncbi:uncharacterized protein LOC129240105 [Anastrepha obliqua]|uniref:uncharacterized protein LOC129240105 n=1 Tax=Anastrepha obliqua TaxID=95512 RepID=UPI0024099A5D|nr:uncharacterized protein LOC129240105 [Anastrepha obliqua]